MNKMEAGYNLMVSCRPSMNLAVRQDFVKRANAVLIATRRRLSRTCACTTDDDDERRTIQDGCQSRSYMAARSMPSLRWADTGPVAWPPLARGRVAVHTPGGRRAVLSERAGALKVRFLVSTRRSPEPAPAQSGFVAAVAGNRPPFGGFVPRLGDEFCRAAQ